MNDLTISYKGSQIASMNASGIKTLLTKAKYCEDDISVYFKKTGDAVAEGDSSISVDDAKSGNACSLIQYGVCEQDAQTNAISCNNGVLSVSSGEIVTTAANSETLTVGSQTTTVNNLYSINNVRDEQEFMTGTVVHKTAACIYDGTQPVGDRYISSTGAKDNGAIIIYPLETEYTNSSLVSFTEDTVRDVNLLEASIEPIQNLNGYNNPWPAGGGVNKWDEEWELGAFSNSTGAKSASSNTIRSKNTIAILPETEYCFVSSNAVYLYFYDANGDFLPPHVYKAVSGGKVNFTSPQNACYMNFYSYGTSYSQNKSINYPSTVTTYSPYSNICPISGLAGLSVYVGPTQDPDDATVYNVDWTTQPGTVYGGTLDVVTGVLTVDKTIVDLGSIYWTYESGYTYPYFIGTMPNDCVVGSTVQGQISVLCSIYESIQNIGASAFRIADHNYQCCLNSNVVTRRLLVQNSAYTDAETFKTAMSGVQLVYDLETPITYQLTPYEINTVLGTNYIFASSASSIKVAISNPVIEYVTPHPFTLSSGSNTITASNLSVSSVPLRLEYRGRNNGPWKKIGETEFEITTSSTTATDVGYIDVLKSEVDDVNKVLCLQVVRTSYPYTSRYHGSIYFIVCDSDNPRINRYGGGASYNGVTSFPSGNLILSAVSVTTTPSGGSVYPVIGVYDSDYYRITLKGKSSDSYTVIGTFEAKVYLVDWPDGINPFEGVYS